MTNHPKRTYSPVPAAHDGTVDPDASRSSDAAHAKSAPAHRDRATLSRRRFLEAAGFTVSLAALSGCRRADEELALPFVQQPVGRVPGRLSAYASTCAGCSAGCGLLIGVRDGRPLKMEGMPEHPLSRGGLCAVGQALPLGLYDSHRLTHPLHQGKQTTWSDLDGAIKVKLDELASSGGSIRFVTPTVTSPTLQACIDQFLSRFENARHVTYDAMSCSAILDAHEKTHGKRVLPHFRLDQARVIVSFGADFLGTWISPVEFTAAWSTGRAPAEGEPHMSYHVQLEGRMSLTGSNADRRFRLAPDEYAVTLSYLARELASKAGMSAPKGSVGTIPLPASELAEIVDRLWYARGESLVLCDSQDVEVQLLVNAINHYLGNYTTANDATGNDATGNGGKTVDIARPSRQKQSNDAAVLELIEELRTGKVSALFVAGTDLTHNLPDHEAMAEAIGNVPLVVSFAEREDDFATHAHFVCPDLHPLQSWMDAEPVSGTVCMSQPTMRPLGETRSILESLAHWSGRELSALEIVQDTWKKQIFPRVKADGFERFWEQAVHDGFVQASTEGGDASEFRIDAVKLLGDQLTEEGSAEKGLALTLHCKVGLPDSQHAHNAWLQELPDPISKVTWDNYVSISDDVARDMKIADGDVVLLKTADGGRSVELPALVQPGQHARVLAVALAYGVRGTDRFADIGPEWLEGRPTTVAGSFIGKNVANFVEPRNGELQYWCGNIKLRKTGRRHHLATTQRYQSLSLPPEVAPHGAEVRDIVQKTTLPAFAKDPHAGASRVHHHSGEQLWPEDHPQPGHSWGMVIDLNKCSGCSACLIACQSENNVPVVGKDEVRRQREMHWIRIDRYYSGEGDNVTVAHQPMMCHHCDNAPCETVCPVLATVHGAEGLNEQAYNRCVGTRYCANNCPYKVRRFNWFKYQHEDAVQNLAMNPDVTVRTRGVMEKCSMCVQRIEEAKINAKRNDRPLVDGEALTACQQSCPARAIEFGDLNDPTSRVHVAAKGPRSYRVLEEFNFRPSVGYLRMVRNSDAEEAENGDHV